jgi:hypothetical protein
MFVRHTPPAIIAGEAPRLAQGSQRPASPRNSAVPAACGFCRTPLLLGPTQPWGVPQGATHANYRYVHAACARIVLWDKMRPHYAAPRPQLVVAQTHPEGQVHLWIRSILDLGVLYRAASGGPRYSVSEKEWLLRAYPDLAGVVEYLCQAIWGPAK